MGASAAAKAFVLLSVLSRLAPAQSPTTGWTPLADNFYVQRPWDLAIADRYEFKDGIHTCWTRSDDKPINQETTTDGRTEMRWDTFANQAIDHMWDADMMIEPGSDGTCVMQVKSNTGGEAVYMQVFNGDLHWGARTGKLMIADAYGVWFNLKAAYNPKTRLARVWINDVLKDSRTAGDPVTDWYFKNGTYGTTGVSKAHFKNMKHWTYGGAAGIAPLAPQRPSATAGTLAFDARGRLVWMPAAGGAGRRDVGRVRIYSSAGDRRP